MKRFAAVALWLALALPAFGQSVKLPAEIKSAPGMILVTAETDCAEVLWVVPPTPAYDVENKRWVLQPSALQIIPPDLLKSTKTAVCFVTIPGVYTLQAIVSKGDKSAQATAIVLVIGNGPPTPPTPVPPVPPVPQPTDPLVKEFQAAYERDRADPQRAARLKLLIELMDEASAMADSSDIKTLKQLNDAVRSVAETKIGKRLEGALTNTRNAVGEYLNTQLPTSVAPDAPITAGDRAKVRVAYKTVANALRGVK